MPERPPPEGRSPAPVSTWYAAAEARLERHRLAAAVGLALLAVVVLGLLTSRREYGTYYIENDFYMFYAEDARLIQDGEPPEALVHGPGFPALVALIEPVTGSFYVAGVAVSLASLGATAVCAYLIARSFLPAAGALAAEILVVTSEHVALLGMSAATDELALAFSVGCLAVLMSRGQRAAFAAVAAGALAGCAYLVRYNSAFLLVTGVVAILLFDVWVAGRVRARLRLSGLFLGAAFVVALPWFVINWAAHGSPLASESHLRIVMHHYGYGVSWDGHLAAARDFGGTMDVLTYDPPRLARSYVETLVRHSLHTGWLDFVNPLVALGAAGAAVSMLAGRRDGRALTLLLSGVLFVAVQALLHWEGRYFIYIAVLYAVLAAVACWRLPGWAAGRGLRLPAATPLMAVAVVAASSLALTAPGIARFLDYEEAEAVRICPYFEGEGLHDTRVIARHAFGPAGCGQRTVLFPLADDLGELRAAIGNLGADYLLYGELERQSRPGLRDLDDPARAPDWLEPVYTSDDGLSHLYRVAHTASGE